MEHEDDEGDIIVPDSCGFFVMGLILLVLFVLVQFL